MQGWFRACEDGLELFVRLTPKSGRDAVEGLQGESGGGVHLIARVRAVPEDGKANEALEALIAKVAGIAKSRANIIAGRHSRQKTVRIACAPGEAREILRRLENAD